MDIKHQAFTFDDVSLVPQFTEAERGDIDIRSSLFEMPMLIPVISSPMDTISGMRMLEAMLNGGGIGIRPDYSRAWFKK